MMSESDGAIDKLKRVAVLVLDVDGVLTDGSIVYTDAGDEVKSFSARDGLGIRLLMDAGITVCIITGRRSNALMHRCRDLGITHVIDGAGDKRQALMDLADGFKVPMTSVACMGDDLPDIPMFRMAGLSIAVADADETVKQSADLVTTAPGGAGAVRELAERILKTQARWKTVTARFQ